MSTNIEVNLELIKGMFENQVKQSQKSLDNLASTANATNKSIQQGFEKSNVGLKVFAANIASNLVIGAFNTLKRTAEATFRSMITATLDEQKALSKLNAALKATGSYSEETSQHFQDLAEQIEKTSMSTSEAAMEAIAFGKSLGMSNTAVESNIMLAKELAAVTGTDLSSAMQQLNNLQEGQIGTLGRVFPELKKFSEWQLKGGDATEYLRNKLGELSKQQMDSLPGKLKLMNDGWDNFLKAIGKGITDSALFKNILNDLTNGTTALGDANSELSKKLTSTLDKANELYKSLKELDSATIDNILTFTKWTAIILGSAAAITAVVKGIALLKAAWAGIAAFFTAIGAAIASVGLGVVLTVGAIVAAIAAAAYGIYKAIKAIIDNIDWFKEKWHSLLNTIGVETDEEFANFKKSLNSVEQAWGNWKPEIKEFKFKLPENQMNWMENFIKEGQVKVAVQDQAKKEREAIVAAEKKAIMDSYKVQLDLAKKLSKQLYDINLNKLQSIYNSEMLYADETAKQNLTKKLEVDKALLKSQTEHDLALKLMEIKQARDLEILKKNAKESEVKAQEETNKALLEKDKEKYKAQEEMQRKALEAKWELERKELTKQNDERNRQQQSDLFDVLFFMELNSAIDREKIEKEHQARMREIEKSGLPVTISIKEIIRRKDEEFAKEREQKAADELKLLKENLDTAVKFQEEANRKQIEEFELAQQTKADWQKESSTLLKGQLDKEVELQKAANEQILKNKQEEFAAEGKARERFSLGSTVLQMIGIGQKTADTLASAGDSILNVIKEIGEYLAAAWEVISTISEYVQKGITISVEVLSGAFIEQVSGVIKGIMDWPRAVLKVFKNFDKILIKFIDKFPALVSKLVEKLPTIIDGIVEALPKVISTLVENLPSIVKSIIDGLVKVIPILAKGIADAIGPIVQTIIDNLPALLQSVLEAIGTLVGSILDAVPKIIDSLPGLIQQILEYLPTLITIILKKLPAIITSIFDAIPKIIVEIIKAIPEIVMAIANNIGPIVEALITGILQAIPAIVVGIIDELILKGGIFKIVGGIILAVFNAVGGILTGLIKGLFGPETGAKFINWLKGIWRKAGDTLKEAGSKIWEGFKSALNAVGDFFSNLGSNIWSGFKAACQAVGTFFSNLGSSIWSGFKAACEAIGTFFSDLGSSIWNGFKAACQAVGTFFSDLGSTIWNGFKVACEAVGTFFSNLGSAIWSGFKTACEAIGTFFSDLGSKIWTGFKTALEAVANFFSNLGSKIWEGFKAALEAVASVFTKAGGWIWDGLKTAWDTAKDIFSKAGTWIWEGLKGGIEGVATFFSNLGSKIWEGLKSGFDGAGDLFSGVGTKIWNAIKSGFDGIGDFFSRLFKIPDSAWGKGTIEDFIGFDFPWLKFSDGGTVPGRAKFGGDNLANDTVPALLSPGELVLPRSATSRGKSGMISFIQKQNSASFAANAVGATYYKGGIVERHGLWKKFKEVVGKVGENIDPTNPNGAVGSVTAPIVNPVIEVVAPIIEPIVDLAGDALRGLTGTLKDVWNWIKAMGSKIDILDFVRHPIDSTIEVVKSVVGGMLSPVMKNILRRNMGGTVQGYGGVDTIPMLATAGEFVIRRSAAQANMRTLQEINNYGRPTSSTTLDQKIDRLISALENNKQVSVQIDGKEVFKAVQKQNASGRKY